MAYNTYTNNTNINHDDNQDDNNEDNYEYNYEDNYQNVNNDDDDDDDDYDDDENIYDNDERSNTKYNIILCELYNENIHGPSNNNIVNSGFLVMYRFKEFNMTTIKCYILSYFSRMHFVLNNALLRSKFDLLNHHTIRNYNNLYLKIQPEIAECHYLNTGEVIAIKKTFWIKLIQRTWKNIYKKRQEIIKKRCDVKSLMYRELNVSWYGNCYKNPLPSINGMLYYLSKK